MFRWVRALLLGVIMLVCAGCLRYNAQLQVNADGTVSGSFVAAVKGEVSADLIRRADIPPDLQDKVVVRDYAADGYAGAQVTFARLSMAQVGELFAGGQRSGATVRLSLTRNDNEVDLSGAVWFPDLSMLSGSSDGYDALITFTFPGATSVTANGKVEGTQVSWTPPPGELATIGAHAVYPIPAPVAQPAGSHTTIALVTGLTAILVGVLALLVARLLRRRPVLAVSGLVGSGLAGSAPGVVDLDVPTNPYADPYPSVPSGPGLSPESTRRHPVPGESPDDR
jgi:hypothetical protein